MKSLHPTEDRVNDDNALPIGAIQARVLIDQYHSKVKRDSVGQFLDELRVHIKKECRKGRACFNLTEFYRLKPETPSDSQLEMIVDDFVGLGFEFQQQNNDILLIVPPDP